MDISSSRRNRYTFIIHWVSVIFLLVYLSEGVAGSMFSKAEEEVVIFSPMQGIITMNGEPVPNARIERWLKWKDEEGEKDYFSTDEQGRFSIPIKKDVVTLSTISQFVMAQEVRVFVDGVEYPIWAKAKRDKGLYGELGGEPEGFKCELLDEFVRVNAEEGILMTLCKWDSIKN